jgi:hypothetical protein
VVTNNPINLGRPAPLFFNGFQRTHTALRLI